MPTKVDVVHGMLGGGCIACGKPAHIIVICQECNADWMRRTEFDPGQEGFQAWLEWRRSNVE